MFTRLRIALGSAILLSLMIAITVFAKGGFSFITIAGPNLKENIRATDPALTHDFFAFADFYRAQTDVPAEPGKGYEITRYYVDGTRETAFDSLHYYPDSGYVYYDGIANGGSSEYDGKWYTAKPEIKTAFEKVLPGQTQSAAPVAAREPVISPDPTQSNPPIVQNQSMLVIALLVGSVLILLFAQRLRKPSAQ